MALEPVDVFNILVWTLKLGVAAWYYLAYPEEGLSTALLSGPTVRHRRHPRRGSVVHVPLLHRGLAEPREGIRPRALEGRLSK